MTFGEIKTVMSFLKREQTCWHYSFRLTIFHFDLKVARKKEIKEERKKEKNKSSKIQL